MKILSADGCGLHVGRRAVDVVVDGEGEEGKARLKMDDDSTLPVDCIVFCTGRSSAPSLESLHLDAAGVAWTAASGVTVDSHLRSKTARHVLACGDCASAVKSRDRCAIHAGWTGFNAARNALLPWFLRSPAVHRHVPRVIYTDPEIASAGMTVSECTRRYGAGGYDGLLVAEGGTDRADVESRERNSDANFVELRADRADGRILGASACGPAAAEIVNEVCLALANRLTVRDMARTLHSYPSHGYLLYRISTALATGTISGLLASCGPFGRFLGVQLRLLARVAKVFKFDWLSWKGQSARNLRSWQAAGSSNALVLDADEEGGPSVVSFLDAYNNETLRDEIILSEDDECGVRHGERSFIEWVESKG